MIAICSVHLQGFLLRLLVVADAVQFLSLRAASLVLSVPPDMLRDRPDYPKKNGETEH
jgi:hypothetical protein